MDADFISLILLQYVCLLFSLCLHEAAHAGMANWCGDPSARLLGRLTLDPRKHIDPIGTVLFPLIMMATAMPYLFGWAKPVPFNPANLHNMRRDPVLIALAGPASNILLALAAAIVMRILIMVVGFDSPAEIMQNPLYMVPTYLIMINLILALFNMIPVPPLDGHYLLKYFLPPEGQRMLEQIGPFGIIIALVLINTTGILTVPLTILRNIIFFFVFWGNV